jgi:uncharacterized protein (TIGR02757 family)
MPKHLITLSDNNILQIKELLDEKARLYNHFRFISGDPISVPHQFTRKEDIEIAGFFSAILAWGQRKAIINKANELLQLMDYSPYDFISGAGANEMQALGRFQHRTFNGTDCTYFMKSLQNIYLNLGGLEEVFSHHQHQGIKAVISNFRQQFFALPYPARTAKHIADPEQGAAAKRINMFLRWMVRKDNSGVDFGIWNKVSPAGLYCPLDLHSGNVARKLGLISRKQNDWKALEELMVHLRAFDAEDPVKYDFALFGLGIFEKF